jgi:hypothetical protein
MLLKYSSIKDGSVYKPNTALTVRDILNKSGQTLGEVGTKFHVVRDVINISYDGILGNDFFESKQAIIDFMGCNRTAAVH